jgi:hypothetical protein
MLKPEKSVISILDRQHQSALSNKIHKENINPEKFARWFPHFWVR